MKKLNNAIRLLGEINKIKITIAVAITALAGYALAAGTIDIHAVLPVTGIFILACGSAAFNQYQEREADHLMKRTQHRPLPSGRIKPQTVIAISLIEIILGTGIIYFGSNAEAALLGFTAFIWYNVIYTPLKKLTPFAVIPGSIIGAIPPMAGWAAAGGCLTEPDLYIMAFFFFMSQVPHYWLLMLKYGDDYQLAGFPVINNVLSTVQIKRVTFIWIVATALNIILLVVAGLIQTLVFKVIVIFAALWLIIIFSKLLRNSDIDFQPKRYFLHLNLIFLLVIISMILDPVFV